MTAKRNKSGAKSKRAHTMSRARLGYVSALTMQDLTLAQRHRALEELARLLDSESCALQDRNEEDMIRARKEKLAAPLMNRLLLDSPKLFGLRSGIKDLIALPDPVGKILKRTQLDEGLILEQKTAPLGLVAVVFES
ncbi:MAG: hypothetical protein K2X47_11100, partial [Bdellovibrionales bacterium]|nr:hypothetical protein [Bdellovibrionales bacterium]